MALGVPGVPLAAALGSSPGVAGRVGSGLTVGSELIAGPRVTVDSGVTVGTGSTLGSSPGSGVGNAGNDGEADGVETDGAGAVSYTHLTLPTKA